MNKQKGLSQIVYEHAEKYAKRNLKEIKVEAGDYMGNKKCQHNARQRVETGEYEKVVACLSFIPKSGVNLHFVNKKGDKYVDNTLGHLAKFNKHFLIKEYTLPQLKKLDTHRSCMYDLFPELQEEYLNKVFTKKEIKEFGIEPSHF